MNSPPAAVWFAFDEIAERFGSRKATSGAGAAIGAYVDE